MNTQNFNQKDKNLFNEIISSSKHIKKLSKNSRDLAALSLADNRFSFGPAKFAHNKEMI